MNPQAGGKGLLGMAALAGGFFLSRTGQQSESNSALSNSLIPASSNLPAPPPLPVLSIGGPKDRLRPIIAGIANRASEYGAIPRVYGTFKMYPPLGGQTITEYRGKNNYLLALLCLGYGPLDIAVSDIKIGDTPITVFEDIAYEVADGSAPGAGITLYTKDIASVQVNQQTLKNQSIIFETPQICDNISLDISFDQGLYQVQNASAEDGGGTFLGKYSVRHDIDVRLAGSGGAWTSKGNLTVEEATTAVVRGNKYFAVSPRGSYEVRVKRTTDDDDLTEQAIVSASTWAVLRAIKNDNPLRLIKDQNGNSVGLAYIALSVKATNQLQGEINQLNCIVKSKLPTYNGSIWTGSTITDNPAWIFADILRGTANKRPVPDSQIDAAGIKAWADWCTDNGRTFNAIIDQTRTIWDVLRDVAAAGRAVPTFKNGKFSVAMDKKQTVIVQHFTPRNSWGFQGERVWLDQPHALKVRFINPAARWQMDERITYDDGYAEVGSGGTSTATKFETVELYGCTSPNQAWKDGRYFLATAKLRRETYTLNADIENLACTQFDLVRVTHDVPKFGLGYGRIVSIQTNGAGDQTGITLDATVPMSLGVEYAVRVRMSDGSSMVKQVYTEAGNVSALVFTLVVPSGTNPAPAVGDLVLFGQLDKESVEMIVKSIEHHPDLSATLTLVDHAPGVYTADTGSIPAHDAQITEPPLIQEIVQPPSVLSIRSDEAVLLRSGDGSLISRIQLVMEQPGNNVQYFEAQHKRTGTTQWGASIITSVSQGEISVVPVVDSTQYDIRVRSISFTSRLSTWTLLQPHQVIGKTTKPPDVPILTRQGSTLQWAYDSSVSVTVPRDFAGFRVKFNYAQNTNWTDAIVAAQLITATQYDMSGLPQGVLTVLVRAVDMAGNESANSAVLLKDLGDPVTANILITESHAPNFTAGTITNGTVIGGVLKANDPGLFWTSDTAAMWSGVDGDLFWNPSYQQMTYAFSYKPNNSDGRIYAPLTLSLDTTITAENYQILYRTLGNNLFWNRVPGADSDPFWVSADTALFWESNPPYIAWPGSGEFTFEQIDWKILTSASQLVQGQISQCDVVVDVPDLTETVNDFVTASGGSRLPLTKTYREIKHVTLTLQQNPSYSTARTVEVIDKLKTGPLVQIFDSSHTGVAGEVDAFVRGY